MTSDPIYSIFKLIYFHFQLWLGCQDPRDPCRRSVRSSRSSNTNNAGPGPGGGSSRSASTGTGPRPSRATVTGATALPAAAIGTGAVTGDTGPTPAAVPVPIPPTAFIHGVDNRSTASLRIPTARTQAPQRGSTARVSRTDANANTTTTDGSGAGRATPSTELITLTHRSSGHGLNFQTIYSALPGTGAGAGAEGAADDASATGGVISVTVTKAHTFPAIWNEFRASRTLCDVELKTMDRSFYAHRAILAASSPFFNALFTTQEDDAAAHTASAIANAKDGDTDEEERPIIVPLLNIDSQSLSAVLEFMYTGQLKTPAADTDLVSLILLSQHLQLPGLLELCRDWILDHLNPTNALQMYRLARAQLCPGVQLEIKHFILDHFFEITATPEYKQLEFDMLEEFLRDDQLNAKSEECVFIAIRDWIEAEPSPARLSRLIELLQCIRFGLMSFNYFTSVVYNWKHVQNNAEVARSLFDASLFLASLDSTPDSEVDLNDPLARPRVPNQLIFAVGGWSAGSPTNFMETYDIRSDRWFLSDYNDTNRPRAYHGLVTVDGLIYIVGGFDGTDHFNTVRCFDPVAKVWSEKSCMHFPRCYVSCCVLDRHIYALGGFNGRARMNTVERYSVDRNQWDIMPPMSRQRSDASAAALKGKIYIAGGFNGQEVLASVEVFDPAENQWSFIRQMNTPRSGVTLTVHKNFLYAIGGFNGFTRLATGERYDPSADPLVDWEFIANMNTPRSNFAAVAVDDWLFAIGGFNGSTTIHYCECYDNVANEWYDICSMNLNRSALSACVLHGLRNAREYSFLSRVHELLGLTAPSMGATGTASGRPRTRPRHRIA